MADTELNLLYHGLLLPKITHSEESLEYLQKLTVKDDDVIAVTYPKSGYDFLPQNIKEDILKNVGYWHPFTCIGFEVNGCHCCSFTNFLQNIFTCVLRKNESHAGLKKEGTTWMQEILPPLLHGGDLTAVQTIPNWDRVPWMEETRASLVMDKIPSPRAMVSHMPYNLMPSTFFTSKAKVIYVTRNPKDVLVSSFHFHKMASFLDDPGTFEEFTDKFLAGKVLFGKWTDHVKSWRNPDLGDRILYVTYEEMVQDLRGVLERMLNFLGRQLSAEALDSVVKHSTFTNMKTNSMSNYSLVPEEIMDSKKSPFLRKGISGDWKNHFSPELDAKFTATIQEELKDSNIKFPWDNE